MNEFNRKQHWETLYQTKALEEVSWYQPSPETSLQLIEIISLPKEARIIDVGGGDSFLVDHLLDLGFKNLSVLDVSEAALQRAQQRLGDQARNVQWICADVTQFQPERIYDLWHDRAAFHFLTNKNEIQHYVHTATQALLPGGHLIIGTFSEQGPKKCSGIAIQQYSETSLLQQFSPYFSLKNSMYIDHPTPFGTLQNFLFCTFKPNFC
jgi:ubiquinone/menaquinone biosynthesis C-methylase UbiE